VRTAQYRHDRVHYFAFYNGERLYEALDYRTSAEVYSG
jgi:hypothetical protein